MMKIFVLLLILSSVALTGCVSFLKSNALGHFDQAETYTAAEEKIAFPSTETEKRDLAASSNSFKYCAISEDLKNVLETATANVKRNKVAAGLPLVTSNPRKTFCYRGVKWALYKNNIITQGSLDNSSNAYACQAADTLTSLKFVSVPYFVSHPDEAPDGTIFVYEKLENHCGKYKKDKQGYLTFIDETVPEQDDNDDEDAEYIKFPGHIEFKYSECDENGVVKKTKYVSHSISSERANGLGRSIKAAFLFPGTPLPTFLSPPPLSTPPPVVAQPSYALFEAAVIRELSTVKDINKMKSFEQTNLGTVANSGNAKRDSCMVYARKIAYNVKAAEYWLEKQSAGKNTQILKGFFASLENMNDSQYSELSECQIYPSDYPTFYNSRELRQKVEGSWSIDLDKAFLQLKVMTAKEEVKTLFEKVLNTTYY